MFAYLHKFEKLLKILLLRKIQIIVQQTNANEELAGKVCVVTGGARGLGLCLAKRLLDSGATVIAVGRNEKKLEDARRAIASSRFFSFAWDLTNIAEVDLKIEKIASMRGGGKIDVWVNNAAYISLGNEDADVFCAEKFDKTMEINVKSLLAMSFSVANYFKRNAIRGKIINISSMNSLQGSLAPYYISKRAVNCITEGLAKKFLSAGIVVNGVAPGILPSGHNETDISQGAYCDALRSKRFVLLEEVAELVAFLASDKNNSIVGQTIVCDGGTTLR